MTTSLWSLFQCSTTLWVKDLLLIFNLNLHWYSFMIFLHVLSLVCLLQIASTNFLRLSNISTEAWELRWPVCSWLILPMLESRSFLPIPSSPRILQSLAFFSSLKWGVEVSPLHHLPAKWWLRDASQWQEKLIHCNWNSALKFIEFHFCLPPSKWLHWPQGYAAKAGQQMLNSTLLQHGNSLEIISILLVRCGQALNLHYKDMQAGTWTLGSPETSAHLDIHSSWIQVLIFIHFMARKLRTCLVPQSVRDGVLRPHFGFQCQRTILSPLYLWMKRPQCIWTSLLCTVTSHLLTTLRKDMVELQRGECYLLG